MQPTGSVDRIVAFSTVIGIYSMKEIHKVEDDEQIRRTFD